MEQALPYCPFTARQERYVISVRQARGLPVVSLFPHPASFRFHLAMDTLAFGYILPTTGRIRDFHPLETCAAGRTTIKGGVTSVNSPFFNLRQSLIFTTIFLIGQGPLAVIRRGACPSSGATMAKSPAFSIVAPLSSGSL